MHIFPEISEAQIFHYLVLFANVSHDFGAHIACTELRDLSGQVESAESTGDVRS